MLETSLIFINQFFFKVSATEQSLSNLNISCIMMKMYVDIIITNCIYCIHIYRWNLKVLQRIYIGKYSKGISEYRQSNNSAMFHVLLLFLSAISLLQTVGLFVGFLLLRITY
jgi:hypothetical protein